MSTSGESSSAPYAPDDSPGSSVSSRLQEEYDELLKYAVVVPNYDPSQIPRTLQDVRESFMQYEGQTPVSSAAQTRRLRTQQLQQLITEPSQGSRESSSQEEISDNHTEDGQQELLSPEEAKQQDEHLPRSRPPTFQKGEEFGRFLHEVETPESDTSTVSVTQSEASAEGSPVAYSPSVDQDITRMEHLLDQWCYDLRRNVLAEFSQSKIKLLEQHKRQMLKEKERHAAEVSHFQNELEGMKELLHTYEQSIERKDQVISNLTRALQNQRDKGEMQKKFSEWKIRAQEKKREAFASTLARKHRERLLQRRAWEAWHAIVEAKWRHRVEKACQAKAQEVCMALTNDYEAKIASLNEALESARSEVEKLHTERDTYEETMKKAFMRGVCALNMEAMTMFHEGEGQQAAPSGQGPAPNQGSGSDTENHAPRHIPTEPVYTSQSKPSGAPPRVVTSIGGRSSQTYTASQAKSGILKGSTSRNTSKQKVISAKVSARSDLARSSSTSLGGASVPMGLAPLMSSVLVERHQPVNKETIGHATAMRYPRSSQGQVTSQTGVAPKRPISQSGTIHLAAPNIHTVKVVD